MLDQHRLVEALIGPPSDPYRLAPGAGNPRKVLFRASHIDRIQLIARDVQPQRHGAVERLLRIAQAALDEKRYHPHLARIWWD